ncbi:MAG: Rieske (2Fe-2S) protein [Geobacteraceae bacterium]|nr:Rieske (2Fe-2S) protein [Geobacteraceae bacterium]
MKLNRRQFVILSAGLLAGCAMTKTGINGHSSDTRKRDIDAGPADAFREEGVYDRFRNQGFFLIRRHGRLLALSSSCTHRSCTLNTVPDRTFICPCHGSTFDAKGAVTKGPAQKNMPLLPVRIDSRGRVLVQVSGTG